MFENQRGMLPLMLGLGILQANQPSRAPVRFGGVLGQGLASGFGNYLQMQQQAQAAERERRKEERDKQMFDLKVQQLNAQLEAKKQRDNYLRSMVTPYEGIGPVRQQRDGRDAAEALLHGLNDSDIKLIQGSPVKPPESRVINLPDGREQLQEFVNGQWVNAGTPVPRWKPDAPDDSPPKSRTTPREDGYTYRQEWDGKKWVDTGESWPTYQKRGMTDLQRQTILASRRLLERNKIDPNKPLTPRQAMTEGIVAAQKYALMLLPEEQEAQEKAQQKEIEHLSTPEGQAELKTRTRKSNLNALYSPENKELEINSDNTFTVKVNNIPGIKRGAVVKAIGYDEDGNIVLQDINTGKKFLWSEK